MVSLTTVGGGKKMIRFEWVAFHFEMVCKAFHCCTESSYLSW
jgi:hypothetical protein